MTLVLLGELPKSGVNYLSWVSFSLFVYFVQNFVFSHCFVLFLFSLCSFSLCIFSLFCSLFIYCLYFQVAVAEQWLAICWFCCILLLLNWNQWLFFSFHWLLSLCNVYELFHWCIWNEEELPSRVFVFVGFHSLGSPLWDESLFSSSSFRPSLFRFMYSLRSIVRRAYAVAMVTIPMYLFQAGILFFWML